MSIGARLREERTRLGLNQTQLAEIGGIKKASQHAYEQAKRVPDANYFSAVSRVGVDILFVISGEPQYLCEEILRPVTTVLLEWMSITDREMTPELLADVFTLLYNGGLKKVGDEYMAQQMKLVG